LERMMAKKKGDMQDFRAKSADELSDQL